MRADIHGGPEQKLQSEAGYIDARPQTDSSTKTSCNARPDHTSGSKCEILAGSRCFPLFSQHRTFGATARQGMLKAQRFTLTMPACVLVSAIGLVERSLNGSHSPSARRVHFSPIAAGRIRSPSASSVMS